MKKVLITGAAKGIGKAIAEKLFEEGYQVLINYNTSEKDAKELAHKLSTKAYQTDVSNYLQVKDMYEKIKFDFGNVDILINNAGISNVSLFQDLTVEKWNELFSVNVCGCFNTIHCVLPDMISNKNGVILNVSSIWGSHGASCEVAYSATKGAIESLTKSLALELAPSNIRVNAIAPGTVKTDMMKCYTDEDMKYICENIPMMRMAEPKEIAELVSFLISDKNSYMTGQIISTNGGMGV
ncbi:3-oxoacyl-[acyl-carrier protein] reductase [Peptoniphilus asaccharolyticus DSM 20463]|uniref:3-oxoacyl-[acyl-carrier protein] reductase n=1 Tax=Peptoniphilus asaccharolyticus DSM 20463 TaxID=573058 RepID=A0A1W1VK23_PEPAS|nr:SDR family oxidoreductase [Peptoniphilus asaccharolyticus]MBL7574440.1 SDR family oxidoreductase [Peptoniphilus asaccharolyticus]SMB93717.1 3-oxoacyl-[acyl-carrier protein] reductase [Peptoniphilus asaccharolyticus DSM 20463]